MTVSQLRRRLQASSLCMRDRAYGRLALLWSSAIRPEQSAEVQRLFFWLVDWEVAAGTPLESLLARLPRGMADEIRRAFQVILAAEANGSPGA